MLPAKTKLLDHQDSPRSSEADTIFIMAERWAGFVKLTTSQKKALESSARIRHEPSAEIPETYRLLK